MTIRTQHEKKHDFDRKKIQYKQRWLFCILSIFRNSSSHIVEFVCSLCQIAYQILSHSKIVTFGEYEWLNNVQN